MNKEIPWRIPLAIAAVILSLTQTQTLNAQQLTGANQPGGGSAFAIPIAAGVTNFSLQISNTATVYSHLYLKKGAGASPTTFDFAARLNVPTNSLNLELPELEAGTDYSLWVQTPATSAAHAFSVAVSSNRLDAKTGGMPISKQAAFAAEGGLTAGETHYYQVDVPAALPGWRIVLAGTGGTADPDVYIQRGGFPTPTSYLKRSLDRAVDTLFLDAGEATAGTYFISVTIPRTDVGSASYSLGAELASVIPLVWEPGTTAIPSASYTNQSTLGGDYYFKISTLAAASGIWRTRVDVQSGDADLLLRRNSMPTQSTYDFASARAGSDGVALVQTGQYQPGQEWYLMVTAIPGAQWSIYSGNLFVTPLPTPVAGNGSSTNTVVAPEGMNFYRTTTAGGTLAWRLGLGGLTNNLYVRQSAPAHSYSSTYYDWRHPGEILLVPPYLKSATEYFVTVTGTPGQAFTLDSREQPIIDLPFDSATEVVATNFGYLTYRVSVPAQQIGWQLDLLATSGEPALAARHAAVASEDFNHAFSDTSGSAAETITLVPPVLTDGTYYLTVYGTPPYSATLTNTRPIVTDVSYAFSVTNDIPERKGWRFYRLTDIDQQLNVLGWELLLNKQLPNTELALRRNYMPGRWVSATNANKKTTYSVTKLMDDSSVRGFLQRPRHAADIWYIGVNQTNQALGPFVLSGREIPRPEVALGVEFQRNQVTAQPAGMIQYFQVEVPAEALGMELRVINASEGDPRVVVCRGMLPVDLRTMLVTSNNWTPNTSSTWPIGAQIHYNTDWTGFTTDANRKTEAGRFFFAGKGNPLEPGTYYIGVLNGTGNNNEMDYELLTRGILPEGSFLDLPFVGNRSRTDVEPHESVWHRIDVPANTESWKLRLRMDSGDGLLVMRSRDLPNYGAAVTTFTNIGGAELQKLGNEHFVLLPRSPATNIPAGTYYVGVVGEGQGPAGTRAGSNTCSFTLVSEGAMNFANLGTVDRLGVTSLLSEESQEGGETRGFRFSVVPNTPVIEVRLRQRTGNPRMVLRADTRLAALPDTYGYSGGWPATWTHDNVIRIPAPEPGDYTLLVQAAGGSGGYTNATYTLDVSAQQPQLLAFDYGMVSITNQLIDGWNYFLITVPENATGWDLRLADVTEGDPELVICRDAIPFNLSTRNAAGGTWNPFTATNWPAGNQVAPDKDWTEYTLSASGTNQTGRIFTAGLGNPLEAGNYIVGVASGGKPAGAKGLTYTLLSRGIGTNLAIPVQPLAFASGETNGFGLPPREVAFYRVDVPTNAPNWQFRAAMVNGEAMMVVRKDGLPNFGAAVGTAVTNLAGTKLQKIGNEHFALLPVQPAMEIHAGSYYIGIVSEGVSPGGTRIGSNSCDYVVQSLGNIRTPHMGEIDALAFVSTNVAQEGGAVRAYEFDVAPATVAIVVRLDNQVGKPTMTLRAGPVLPRSLDAYGRQGGWPQDWSSTNYIQVNSPVPGRYSLLVHAGAASGQYPNAAYTLRIYSLEYGTIPLAFDGGREVIKNHLTGGWLYFAVDVPTNAIGWDLRLTNITSGSPRLVVCRSGYPIDLTSRLRTGGTWNWGSATNWPVGAQAAPAIDWTGAKFETNGVDTTGTIFAAGLSSPVEPGPYIVGVSSAPGTTAPMSYSIVSRGIGNGFMIPVEPLSAGKTTVTNLALGPREAAYYSLEVPTNTPLWKLDLQSISGEGLMALRKDALPNVFAATNVLASGLNGGHKFVRTGDEYALLGQTSADPSLPAGNYYVAVVGQGSAPLPSGTTNGGGDIAFKLQSTMPAAIHNLGSLNGGGNDLVVSNSLSAGDTVAYEFNLAPGALGLTLSLENFAGSPFMRLRGDEKTPLDAGTYGQDGGFKGSWEGTDRISLNSPSGGVYRVTVMANSTRTNWPNLNYTLRVHAEAAAQLLSFDGGSATISNHTDLWRVYAIQVPSNAVGWDLRIVNATSGAPRMVIRRDQVPSNLTTQNGFYNQTTWKTGTQVAPGADWTGLNDAGGGAITGRVFQVGMGNPLEPGIYYVGVTNTIPQVPASYTIVSRGIGATFSVPVIDLGFAGGSANQVSLPAREAAWFRVEVPESPSWKVGLNFDSGAGLLLAQKAYLPSIAAHHENELANAAGGKKMQKTGDEHLLALGSGTAARLEPGVYYLGVVSEGQFPSNSIAQIGTGSSAFTLWSAGEVVPVQLGIVGASDLLGQASLAGGEAGLWSFSVPFGIPAAEVFFEETNGAPVMTLVPGSASPAAAQRYGADGGTVPKWQSGSVITIPNPAPTNFSITVQATGAGVDYANANFKLRVRNLPIANLSFAPQLNSATVSNTASGTLLDGHRAYFRVQVPQSLGGQPVIGWKLSLGATFGTPVMRVRRDALPEDGATGTSAYFLRQSVMVPDFLTPGTWYVEVKATGLTGFQLTSEALDLYRPAWQMPVSGQPVSTPGLPANGSLFGDTGVSVNGTPLPGDGGTDVEQESFHYYAVVIPPGNGGLLRTQLEAISGNPNLYLRTDAPPTLSHNAVGAGGPLFTRALTNAIGTEYGNWAPLNGRSEVSLPPGVWYMAVHAAGGSHVRYRLLVSTGDVTPLQFTGGRLAAQTLAAGDWRYYKVTLPEAMPDRWTITFSEQQGDVTLYVRDTVPPGQGLSTTNYIDWGTDNKNHSSYLSYANAGSHTVSVPPVRPGNTYYLGVRATTDASFTISSTPGANLIALDGVIPFKGGFVTNQIAAGGVLRYRIDVPADARRWTHTSVHPSTVRLFIDQGTLPTMTLADHWSSVGANSSYNAVLYNSSWPWLPGQSYYLAVTNTSTAAQPFSFTMDGKDCSNDDFDNDGLPDCWEIQYYGNILTYGADSDPDGDGKTNMQEYLAGTNPMADDGELLVLKLPFRAADGTFGFYVEGTPNRTYRVQSSETMLGGQWQDRMTYLQTVPLQLIELPATSENHQFYRVVYP